MGFQGMNRKGNIPDLVFIVVIMFTFAIMVFLGFKVYSAYSDQVMDNEYFNTTTGVAIDEAAYRTLAVLDYAYIFLFLGLILSTIILGFQIRTHPVFFFLSFLALIVVTIVSAQFSNIFSTFTESPEIASITSNYIIISYIMGNLPMFIVFAGIAIMVVFYAKDKFLEA
jgi:hypothetical protein